MCGRFTHMYTWRELHALMSLHGVPVDLPPRYNVAPTQLAPVVRADAAGQRSLALLRWGLIPSWAKDASLAGSTINARAETIDTKPAFRSAFRHRRCIVPVSGFFEWQRAPAPEPGLFGAVAGTPGRAGAAGKRPYYVTLADDRPMLLAGLWESWRDPVAGADQPPVETFTVVTTGPNALMATLHDRMPVIIDPADVGAWLDAGTTGPALSALMRPCPDGMLKCVRVSSAVNSPRQDSPDCIVPIDR